MKYKKHLIIVVISFIFLFLLLSVVLYNPLPWESPTLYFAIYTDSTKYHIGDNINITIIIKNTWYKPIKITHPSVLGRTLHFEILTPEGYCLHYKGRYIGTLELPIILYPNEKYTKTINLLDPLYTWGENNSIPYNFSTEGIYFVRAVYISGVNYCWDKDVWEGTLYSNIIHFELIGKSICYESVEDKF